MKKHNSAIGKIIIFIALLVSFVFGASSVQAARVTKIGMILLPEDDPSNILLNEISKNGFNSAIRAYSLTGNLYSPATNDDIEAAFRQCALDGNNLCIGLNFLMQDALFKVAKEFPSTKFALNDINSANAAIPSNTRIIVYNVRQAGYLAGVLSAYMTTSDHLGVIGGMDIPSVNEFIEGYRNAVRCTNSEMQVEVVYADDFYNPDLGTTLAQQLMLNGADIIYPVAWETGNGALTYATQNGAWAIGVNFDQYYSVFEGGNIPGADKILTSTVKYFDKGIYYAISDLVKGRFTGGYKYYGLKEGAVGLASYHETSNLIPNEVKKIVNRVKMDIIRGRINVYNPCW